MREIATGTPFAILGDFNAEANEANCWLGQKHRGCMGSPGSLAILANPCGLLRIWNILYVYQALVRRHGGRVI